MNIKSISPEVAKACDFFKELHEGQKRKDGIRPYFEGHLLPVAELVWEYSGSETLVVVALAHDSKEDQNISLDEIEEAFGKTVTEYVWFLTDRYTKEDFPSWNRAKRKQAERERYGVMPDRVKLVKLADVVANLRDDNGDAGFMQMYVREKLLCLPYLKVEHPLFSLAVATAKEKAAKYGIKVDSL
jgi:(p)ppGpp synthase/HD superfamily hydrolase